MYSRKVVQQRLELFAAQNAWMPEYHSLDEVEKFKAMMDEIVKLDGNSKSKWIKSVSPMTDKRKAEIYRWIENEMVLCTLDSNYWETRYAYVCNEGGQIYKYQPRLSQRIIDEVIAEFDEKQVSIELLILKGRQLGVTSWTALKFIRRMLFFPHTQAVMASVKSEASQLIGRILDTAHEHCPYWLVPISMPKKSFSNGSILSVQSGMQATGLAQGWTPTCLVPGSLIRVANGFVKKIEEVAPSDTIITHTGKTVKVKEAFQTLRGPDHTRVLKLWGNYSSLECTLEHRIKTPEGWVEASEISVGDYVCHPVRQITKEVKSIPAYSHGRGRFKKENWSYFNIPLTSEMAYLCGFYLAEGTCHGNVKANGMVLSEVVFAVHKKEVKDRMSRIKKVLGRNQSIRIDKRAGNASMIVVTNAWFARFIAENLGRTNKKTIPDWVWQAGRPFCKALLKGYMDGDGHCDKQSNNVVAPSVCQQLLLQMRDLVASLGLGWSSIYLKEAHVQGRMKFNHADTWKIILSGPTGYRYRKLFGFDAKPTITQDGRARHWRYSRDRKNIELMVESVSNGFSEKFYDIEVDHRDHSFTTDQCAVHNCIHISELADIPDPKRIIEEGLFRATHSSKNLFMVLEGTGGGNTGWLADTWRYAKENWNTKVGSRLCPIFIPWPMCPEIYPQEDWLRKYPVENSWRPNDTTRKHITRCESYIRNTSYLAKVAGRDWRMPIEQQWFWEFNYLQACGNHSQKTWLAQMPADDYEALTGVHDTVFDPEVLDEIEANIYNIRSDRKERKNPVQAYAIIGHDVDESFYPDPSSIDETIPSLQINWKSNRGQQYEWELIPLIELDEELEQNTMDRIIIYEEPRKGCYYSCGIDTADGLGKEEEDRTVLSITNNRFQGEADRQVVEFTSNKVNAAQVVAFAACLGAWYGPYCPDGRGMKYVIEQIGRPGETCQHQLKMLGFHNQHKPKRYDSKKIKSESTTHEGWWSSSWSVPILMTHFIEAVNGGWYIPQSKWLIEELKTLERHVTSGKSKMEHRAGQHDDRVRAAAQSYFTAHDMDILAERAQRRYNVPIKKKNDPDKGKCFSNSFSIGDWRQATGGDYEH